MASWYLRPSQIEIYELLRREKNPFIEAARRFGKTTSILCYVFEELLSHPGWICRWCEPWQKQAREIVMPEIDKIQRECPNERRFKFQTTDSVYIGPGNSRLYLRGVNDDRGESARGPTANIIVADEFGSWNYPEYTVNEALRPQLLTTHGQFIFASSPASDLAHAYYDHKDRAIKESRFIQKIIYDNESLTKEEIEEACKEVGGPQTAAWRREYLCEPVADTESLVIPEYKEDLHDVPDSLERPPFFDAYIGMDLGLNDSNAALFAYVDFKTRTLVIDDEWVANGKNTKEIVEACRLKEKTLWGTEQCRCEFDPPPNGPKQCGTHGLQPYMRWADNELQQLYDMSSLHGYIVSATRKDDKIAAINELRIAFAEGRIKVKKRCVSTRYQLKVGLWNDRKNDFRRGDKIGHLDAVDALIYLYRNISWQHNPYPNHLGLSMYTHFIPETDSQASKEADALRRAFDPFGGSQG